METAKKLFRQRHCLPIMGPCMVIFAVPLLVPGLTLTLVAYSDKTGFSRYGALHVLGMILLASSAFLLAGGVVVSIVARKKTRGRVSPEEEEEEEDGSVSSSPYGSQLNGYQQSTHTAKTLEDMVKTATVVNMTTERNLSDHDQGRSQPPPPLDVKSSQAVKGDSGFSPSSPQFSLSSAKRSQRGSSPSSSQLSRSSSKQSSQPGSKLSSPQPSISSSKQSSQPGSKLSSPQPSLSSPKQSSQPGSPGALSGASLGSGLSALKGRGPAEDNVQQREEAVGGVSRTRGRGGCNFLSSDSEEERVQGSRYTAAAGATVSRDSTGLVRRTASSSSSTSTSSSASSSPSHSSDVSLDVERDLPGVDGCEVSNAQVFSFERLHKAVVSGQEGFHRDLPLSSRGRSERALRSAGEDEQWEDDYPSHSKRPTYRLDQDTNASEETSKRYFANRERGFDYSTTQDHTYIEDNEQTQGLGLSDPRSSESILDNSSCSIGTESPSHGTYSVKSPVSEELLKEYPDRNSTKEEEEEEEEGEDDVFYQSQPRLSVAQHNAETSRSMSPVPLRAADADESWARHSGQAVTVLGSRSGSSTHSSPSKQSGVGSVQSDPSIDAPDHTDELSHSTEGKSRKKTKKKKKKQRKKARDKCDSSDRCQEGREQEEETVQHRGGNLPSPLRSIMHPQHNTDHHVHWPDDNEAVQ